MCNIQVCVCGSVLFVECELCAVIQTQVGVAEVCVLFVECELRAVVQTHVGVTEQASDGSPQRIQTTHFIHRQTEELAQLWTPAHLRDVEAVLSSLSVSHAVEEKPVRVFRAVFDEADVVAGLDAGDGEQVHDLPDPRNRPFP